MLNPLSTPKYLIKGELSTIFISSVVDLVSRSFGHIISTKSIGNMLYALNIYCYSNQIPKNNLIHYTTSNQYTFYIRVQKKNENNYKLC